MDSQECHPAVQILREFWLVDSFRPSQEEIVNSIASGEDILVVMPTGGGKSLCFQLPALMGFGLTIVISPLVALMENQVRDLQERRIAADILHGEISKEKRKQVLEKILRQELKLLYLSPETLLSSPVWSRLAQSELVIDRLVVDEAHCLVQWGETFRPSYRRLGAVRQSLLQLKPQGTRINIAAFTATADRQTQDTIVGALNLENPKIVNIDPYRSNLNLQVQTVWTPKCRRERLLKFLRERVDRSGIIYVRSRRDAEKISDWLLSLNYTNSAYHAGLDPERRRKIEADWLEDRMQFVVSTSAFGMGVNKSDVRWVIHYQSPQLLAEYLQEIGRAGRDGLPADALIFASEPTGLLNPEDKQRQTFFQSKLEKQYHAVRQIFKQLPIEDNINNIRKNFADAEIILGTLHSIGKLHWQDIHNYHRSSQIRDADFDRLKRIQRQAANLMLRYLKAKTCRWQFLLSAFDSARATRDFRCGHCDRCLGKKL